MLSISCGYDWRYLISQTVPGAENYYVNAGSQGVEPPGVWTGKGCEKLGLTGVVDPLIMEALYSEFIDPRDERVNHPKQWKEAARLGKPPRKFRTVNDRIRDALAEEPHASPERKRQIEIETRASQRKVVYFVDLTYSVQKSVSIAYTASVANAENATRKGSVGEAKQWQAQADIIWDAIVAGNAAMLDYMQREAGYSRAGYHGRLPTGETSGRWVDAHEWIVGSFRHHTSRAQEPQLHIHNSVLNRVECDDGEWRTLDSRAIHRVRPAAAAIGERTTEHLLSVRLGWKFATNPTTESREICGVHDDVRHVFSSRRKQVETKVAQLAAEWEDSRGAAPNALEASRLGVWATLDTRPDKERNPRAFSELALEWDQQLAQSVRLTFADVAQQVAEASNTHIPADFDPGYVAAAAIAHVQKKKSVWTKYDLIRALNVYLPDSLGTLSPDHIETLLSELADQALTPQQGSGGVVRLNAPELVPAPPELRRRDGRSVYESHTADKYTTESHLTSEQRLVHLAKQHIPHHSGQLGPQDTLSDDQNSALKGIWHSSQAVNVLIGPAGTGKSRTVAHLAQAWTEQRGPVLGLALSQQAAEVLAGEGIEHTTNIARWIAAHTRIYRGRPQAGDETFQLHPGSLVILDEAAMADTHSVSIIAQQCAHTGSKLLLVGDDRQLSAIDAGGAFRLLSTEVDTWQLHTAHRFSAPWEREASLRLREGDDSILSEYDTHGRIVDAVNTRAAAVMVTRASLADSLAGRHSIVVAATNEQAAHVAGEIRRNLVILKRVEPRGVRLEDGTLAGRGDLIQARRTDHALITPEGRPVTNRDIMKVIARTDSDVTVQRRISGAGEEAQWSEPFTLPHTYIQRHVTLAYAGTVHTAQGITADTSHVIVGGAHMSADALYVGMTRGRHNNTAYVATHPLDGKASKKRARGHQDKDIPTPHSLLSYIIQRRTPDFSAIETVRNELELGGSLRRLGVIWQDLIEQINSHRYQEILGRILSADDMRQLQDDPATTMLNRALWAAELAGEDPGNLLRRTVQRRGMADAKSPAAVIHHRLQQLQHSETSPKTPATSRASFVARTPAESGSVAEYARKIAEEMDTRRRALGILAGMNPPGWAIEYFGSVPDQADAKAEWEDKAATVLAYLDHHGRADWQERKITHIAAELGQRPPHHAVEQCAAWDAAAAVLGITDEQHTIAQIPVPYLKTQIGRYLTAEASAPRYVDGEIRTISFAITKREQQHQLLLAAAEAESDPDRALRLREEARDCARRIPLQKKDLEKLQKLREQRAAWYESTTDIRAAANIAREELKRRRIVFEEPKRILACDYVAHQKGISKKDVTVEIRKTSGGPAEEEEKAVTSASALLQRQNVNTR